MESGDNMSTEKNRDENIDNISMDFSKMSIKEHQGNCIRSY